MLDIDDLTEDELMTLYESIYGGIPSDGIMELVYHEYLGDPKHLSDGFGSLQTLCQYGCESGTFGPAVYYSECMEIFEEYEQEVLEICEGAGFEVNLVELGLARATTRCVYVAIESEAHRLLAMVESYLEEIEDERNHDDSCPGWEVGQ